MHIVTNLLDKQNLFFKLINESLLVKNIILLDH